MELPFMPEQLKIKPKPTKPLQRQRLFISSTTPKGLKLHPIPGNIHAAEAMVAG
jgi:hypothetical protein